MPPASAPQADALLDAWGRRNRKHADRQCQHCGQTFKPRRASSAYCSKPCARTKNGGHNRKPESWWINGRGYVEGRVRADGEVRSIKHHRLVMERHIGRRLTPGEDVHHIDGNKLNNAIENLQLVSHADHTRITNSERTYKRGYRLNLSPQERERRSQHMRNVRANSGEPK